MNVTASLDFVYDTPANQSVLGDKVINGLTKNAILFPTLPHSVADLTMANDDLKNKIKAAANNDTVLRKELFDSTKIWIDNYKTTAKYVSLVANGDETIIVKAGFTPTKSETTPTPKPNTPAIKDLKSPLQSGTIEVSLVSQKQTSAYLYMALPLDVKVYQNGNQLNIKIADKEINLVIDTHREISFDGLDGNKVNIFALAVNLAGTSVLSQPIAITPQS